MKHGFTLLEMLVVVSMIALLTVYVLPFLQPLLAEAKLSNSVKILSHNVYELQVKAQQGVRSFASSTNIDEPIDYSRKQDGSFPTYGIVFSTQTGIQAVGATLSKNNQGYTLLSRTIEKDLLGNQDGSPASSMLKKLHEENTEIQEVELYFIPFSNSIVKRNGVHLSEEQHTYELTLASTRYPALSRTLLFHSSTSLFTPKP